MKQQSALVRRAKKAGVEEYPPKHRWDFKTDSPQKVLKSVSDAIEDTGYHIRRNPVKSKRSHSTDISNFAAQVVGNKRIAYVKVRRLVLGIIAIAIAIMLFLESIPGKHGAADISMIVIGVIMSVLGVLALDAGVKRFKLLLSASFERKSPNNEPEITQRDDVHLTISCGATGKQWDWTLGSREQEILKEDFKELKKRVEAILGNL